MLLAVSHATNQCRYSFTNIHTVFMTDMTSVMTSTSYDVGKLVPEGRAGDDQDIAGMILYITSKAGAYLNGSVLVCDGGRLGVVPSSY